METSVDTVYVQWTEKKQPNMIGKDGFYNIEGIELYRSGFSMPLLDPKVIIEFGSYDGGDGIWLKNQYPKARVVSIEADPIRCQVIRETNEKLGTGLEILEYAVSDFDGEVEFYQTFDPNEEKFLVGGSGSLHRKTEKYKGIYSHLSEGKPIIVRSRTLKTLCRKLEIEKIDLLHMDVEGAEMKVIRGMGSLRPRVIFLEKHLGEDMYEGAYDWKEMKSHLLSLGYFFVTETQSDAIFSYDI